MCLSLKVRRDLEFTFACLPLLREVLTGQHQHSGLSVYQLRLVRILRWIRLDIVEIHSAETSICTVLHRTNNFLDEFKSFYYDLFHLCLFNFPFIYQFHFLMTTLVKSAFWNPADLLIFKSFQQHFSIISKFVCCGFYIKKDVAFTLISFALLKWHQCLSVQLS